MFFLINFILFNFTNFEKNIIIKEKYLCNFNKNSNYYMIVDKTNTIYEINNIWWKLDFKKAEKWNMIEVNNTYKIKGHGIRNGLFNIYPKIYYITKI